VDRRGVLKAVAATAIVGQTERLAAWALSSGRVEHSLIPDKPSGAPNYWCTWAVQNYMYGQGEKTLDTTRLEGDSGGRIAHDAMSEKALLGTDGWASRFHSKVRGDLFLLLDESRLPLPPTSRGVLCDFCGVGCIRIESLRDSRAIGSGANPAAST